MAGFIRVTFKGAHVDRHYDGFSAEARIWDPYHKESKTVIIGNYETEEEANAAIEGFKKAMNYRWANMD
jgi:hypothetical protein